MDAGRRHSVARIIELIRGKTAKALFVVFLLSLSTTSVTGNTKMLPERVQEAAQDRIAAGTCQTLVFGVVDDGKSEVTRDEPGFVTLVADTQQEIVLPAASLDEYLGTYKLRDKFLLKIFRTNNELFAQATGQGPIAIFPSAQNEFFAKAVKASISFTRNPDGAVSGLVLHQNGDHAAPKLSASEIPSEPKEIALDAAASADYVGKYQFDFGAALTGANGQSSRSAAHRAVRFPDFREQQGRILLQGCRCPTHL
jgi:hypothetical protein